jgi:hypothetical protein
MGGYGSGKPRKHCEKQLTADYCRLDVQLLKRRGFVHLGSAAFGPSLIAHVYDWISGSIRSTGSYLSVEVYPNHIVATDRTNCPIGTVSGTYGTMIALVRTPCTFGGTRIWFRCPNGTCRRRVAVLYLAGEIKCRACAQLKYESQYESRQTRSLHNCRSLRWQLGGSANLLEPFFPQRPKGMRWARYQSLLTRSYRAETSYWSAEGRRVSRLLARYK